MPYALCQYHITSMPYALCPALHCTQADSNIVRELMKDFCYHERLLLASLGTSCTWP